MKRSGIKSSASSILRKKAESRLNNTFQEKSVSLSEPDILKLLQELQVHQVELDLQNEELNQALAEARDATELYDFAPIGYFTLSRKGLIIRSNLRGAALLCKNRSELENQRFDFFVSNNTRPAFQHFFEKVFADHTRQSCEIILSSQGKPPINLQASGIITENTQQCLVTLTDISELKLAEEKLRQKEEKYRTLFENMTQGVFYQSADGSVFDANDAILDMFGLTRDQLLGRTSFHPEWKITDDSGKLLKPEQHPSMEAIQTGKPCKNRIVGVFNQAENHYRWLIVNAVPQFRPGEIKPYQVFVTAHDITERRLAEDSLLQSEAFIRNKLKVILDPEGDIGELQLSDFINTKELQAIMEDFYKLTHIGIGILDLKGNVLVGVGWQDICTKFHRVNPETLKNCIESDVILSAGVLNGESKAYRCRNNLWDIMTPIVIGGKHLGNVCLGQFFYDDEVPDYKLFKNQAHSYGFDEQEYMAALNAVPRFSRETVNSTMIFYAKLAGIISSLSYSTIKLSRAFSQEELLTKKLKESELKYRTVADFTYDWEAWRTPDGTNCYVSPSCERITGHSAAEFLADPQLIIQISHPDDQAFVLERYSETLNNSLLKPVQFDFRIINSAGSTRWISHLSTAVFNENGEWLGRRESNRDITEQKQTIQALEESEKRFKNLFELHSAIMLLVDPYTRFIVDANDAASRFYGYSKSALKSMKIDELNDLPEELVKSERERIRQHNLDYFIFRHRLANGENRIVEVHSSPIDFQEKQILFLIIHDITERMLNEREIEFKNEQLVKINAEKDKFFSILAHDLRGPFNGFLGLTQLMSEQLNELTMDEVQKMASSMKNSAANLFRLLENLLHWARFEQGLMSFEPKVVDLLSVVNESMGMTMELARKKEIEIECFVPDSIKVIADLNMLQTIIRNLISNAVKFTRRGGLITIAARNAGKQSVEITIQDTGIGMSESMLENLFLVDVKTNRKGTEGELSTGLGLILCKEFVEKHGGEIRVQSKEGAGSVFYVTFPSGND